MQVFTQEEKTAAKIEAKTAELIRTTCQKHGVSPDRLTEAQHRDARQTATEMVTAEQERMSNPFYQELQAEREKSRLLGMQLDALRSTRNVNAPSAAATVQNADMMAHKLGPAVWNHSLDANGRLQACGIDPGVNTAAFRAEIKEYFGPGSSVRAAELKRHNPARYDLLKNAGRALRLI